MSSWKNTWAGFMVQCTQQELPKVVYATVKPIFNKPFVLNLLITSCPTSQRMLHATPVHEKKAKGKISWFDQQGKANSVVGFYWMCIFWFQINWEMFLVHLKRFRMFSKVYSIYRASSVENCETILRFGQCHKMNQFIGLPPWITLLLAYELIRSLPLNI